MFRFRLILCLSLCSLMLSAQDDRTVSLDLRGPLRQSSPLLYGLMTEEINWAYDGGLYAELLRNRCLLDDATKAEAWSASPGIEISIDSRYPVRGTAYGRALKIHAARACGKGEGVFNAGFWDIPVKPGTKYSVSIYLKAGEGFKGSVVIGLGSRDWKIIYASRTISRIDTGWKKYVFVLRTGTQPVSRGNHFFIAAGSAGTFYLAGASLFPPTYHHRKFGNRIDLMEKLAALHPRFLRFPGGNYLDPGHYDWKKTIGLRDQRAGHPGAWDYRSSDGLGLLEFLRWCEELQMEPVLAVSDGRDWEPSTKHPTDPAKLDSLVQDALDEIEYLSGDARTKWGRLRARDGHPKPFALHYVEIGNEDFFDPTVYDFKFTKFFDAIKRRYPELQVISSCTVATSRKADILDEHYYNSPEWFEQQSRRYDTADRRGPKLFLGEWASHSGSPTTDLRAALSDAAWLTGLERNADIVMMECYAPLFVNVNPGGAQWPHNLIGYDAYSSYGSPSYYMQAMFGSHYGQLIVPVQISGAKRVYACATLDTVTQKVYLKIVNLEGYTQSLQIHLDGIKNLSANVSVTVLSGHHLSETNTLQDPEHLIPVKQKMKVKGTDFVYEAKGYSVGVVEMGVK